MLIKLIRNQPQGNSITGRLVIDGRWFCNTLERVGYQILALCYHVTITRSPKFKRLLPIVNNVPRALTAFTEDSAHEYRARYYRGPRKIEKRFYGERRKCGDPNSQGEFFVASHLRRGGNRLRSTLN